MPVCAERNTNLNNAILICFVAATVSFAIFCCINMNKNNPSSGQENKSKKKKQRKHKGRRKNNRSCERAEETKRLVSLSNPSTSSGQHGEQTIGSLKNTTQESKNTKEDSQSAFGDGRSFKPISNEKREGIERHDFGKHPRSHCSHTKVPANLERNAQHQSKKETCPEPTEAEQTTEEDEHSNGLRGRNRSGVAKLRGTEGNIEEGIPSQEQGTRSPRKTNSKNNNLNNVENGSKVRVATSAGKDTKTEAATSRINTPRQMSSNKISGRPSETQNSFSCEKFHSTGNDIDISQINDKDRILNIHFKTSDECIVFEKQERSPPVEQRNPQQPNKKNGSGETPRNVTNTFNTSQPSSPKAEQTTIEDECSNELRGHNRSGVGKLIKTEINIKEDISSQEPRTHFPGKITLKNNNSNNVGKRGNNCVEKSASKGAEKEQTDSKNKKQLQMSSNERAKNLSDIQVSFSLSNQSLQDRDVTTSRSLSDKDDTCPPLELRNPQQPNEKNAPGATLRTVANAANTSQPSFDATSLCFDTKTKTSRIAEESQSETEILATSHNVCVDKGKAVSSTNQVLTEKKDIHVQLQETYQNPEMKIRICENKNYNQNTADEKVILLVGATGAGKTTLINRLINFFLGASWEDPQKCTLVLDPEEAEEVDQAISQTKWITAYKIKARNNSPLPSSLTILDTPGFGDTRDIEHDSGTIKQLHFIFKHHAEFGIHHLNAVGFVVQASSSQLKKVQSYIFDTILSFLGKDCEEILILLITFADSQTPLVANAITKAGFKFSKKFKFNNVNKSPSIIVENGDDDEKLAREMQLRFWQMGEKSFMRLFVHLENQEDVLAHVTQEVLDKIQEISQLTDGIRSELRMGSSTIQELDKQVLIMKQCVAKEEQLLIQTKGTDNQQNKQIEKVQSKITGLEQKNHDLVSNLILNQKKIYHFLNNYHECRNYIYNHAIKPNVVSTDYFIDSLISFEKKKRDDDWKDKVLLLDLSRELRKLMNESQNLKDQESDVLKEKVLITFSEHIQGEKAVYKYLQNFASKK